MAKKLANLQRREAERRARIHAEIEVWFKEFDTNGDGRLQRDELKALLSWLHPSRPPTEENLDFLIEKATAIESSTMRIPGNKNGEVTWHTVRPCVLDYGDYCKDQAYIESVFRRFDLDESGELDQDELLKLLRSIAPDGIDVDEADVLYVIEQFDTNSNGVIDKDELLPMLAKWSHIAYEKIEAKRAQEALEDPGHGLGKQWRALKVEAKNIGDRLATGGERVISVVQLARQAREKQKVVQSKWQQAADGAVGSGKGKLIRVVEAAKQQQRLEREASEKSACLSESTESEAVGQEMPEEASLLPPMVTIRDPSHIDPTSEADEIGAGLTPRSGLRDTLARAESRSYDPSSRKPSMALLLHSRTESKIVLVDRDRPWEVADALSFKSNQAKVQPTAPQTSIIDEQQQQKQQQQKQQQQKQQQQKQQQQSPPPAKSSACVIL